MLKYAALISLLALCACDAVTIAGSNRLSDNVAVSVGTTITDEGVQKPRGSLRVGLF